jgi:hypothetical protein
MADRSKTAASDKLSVAAPKSMAVTGEALMKNILFSLLVIFLMSGVSSAKELPNAPSAAGTPDAFFIESTPASPAPKLMEKRPIDPTFVSLAIISTGSTFADSYTTLFARQNWLAGKKGVCNMEVESGYLYGTHPTVARAYAVASAKSVASVFAAYYLRKHHSKLWSLPLIGNSVMSLQGVTQNMIQCN